MTTKAKNLERRRGEGPHLLRIPEHVLDPADNLLEVHSLHRPHGGVVHGVGDPRPVHELLHEGLEDGDLQAGESRLDGHPLQKVEVQVAGGGVDGKTKETRAAGPGPIVPDGRQSLTVRERGD